MTADIFASLQAYADPQALGQLITNTSPENADSQAGIFAALMDEYASSLEGAESIEQLLPESEAETGQQVIAFTTNRAFSRAVIDVIASTENISEPDESQNLTPEAASEESESVIWPEDETASEQKTHAPELGRTVKTLVAKVKDIASEKLQDAEIPELAEQVIADEGLNDIPDEMRQEIAYAVNEIAAALRHDDGKDSQPVVKLLGAVAERISPRVEGVPAKTERDSQDEENIPETLDDMTDFTGYAVITNFTPQISHETEKEDEVDSPILMRKEKEQGDEVAYILHKEKESVDESDSPILMRKEKEQGDDVATTSLKREVRDEVVQTAGQEQGRKDSGAQDSSSRPRTNTRHIDSRTQPDDADTSSPAGTTTRRTASHSDFAAYFEGVMTSRRASSRTSPEPLNLRGPENFTQSTGVRDGITNVVRFIRADGVQKARVIVDPPALGRISVELTSGTSGVEASIKVSSEQIRQLVQDQLSELRMNLSQQGVQVAEFTVDVQQDNSGSQNQQGQQQNNPYMNFLGDADDDSETEEFRIDLEEGLLYWVA